MGRRAGRGLISPLSPNPSYYRQPVKFTASFTAGLPKGSVKMGMVFAYSVVITGSFPAQAAYVSVVGGKWVASGGDYGKCIGSSSPSFTRTTPRWIASKDRDGTGGGPPYQVSPSHTGQVSEKKPGPSLLTRPLNPELLEGYNSLQMRQDFTIEPTESAEFSRVFLSGLSALCVGFQPRRFEAYLC